MNPQDMAEFIGKLMMDRCGGQPFSDEPKLMLVGGLKHFLCSIIYGIILPIDEYLSRLLKPPTRMASMEILTSNGAKMSKCVNDDQGVLQWWDMEAAPTAPGTIEPTVLRKSSNNGGIAITAYYMFHPLKMGLLGPPTDFHITSGVQPWLRFRLLGINTQCFLLTKPYDTLFLHYLGPGPDLQRQWAGSKPYSIHGNSKKNMVCPLATNVVKLGWWFDHEK